MQEPLPVDAALPALANAHYEALAAALARVGLQSARALSVLRYNPGKRCTLAVASDTDRYIVKLFADTATVLAVSTVHNVLAGAGLASGRGPTVPRIIGLDTEAALIVTEMYAAAPASELVKRGDADRAGRLAAQWLRAAIKPGAALGDPYDPPHVLEDVQRYVRTIAKAAGEVDDLVDPARLRWYRTAALLKFASHRARRGAGDLAASLVSDAENVFSGTFNSSASH